MANRRLSSLSLQESSCPLRKQSYRLSEEADVQEALRSTYTYQERNLSVHSIIGQLYQEKIIGRQMKDSINAQASSQGKARVLLDHLEYSDTDTLMKYCAILEQSDEEEGLKRHSAIAQQIKAALGGSSEKCSQEVIKYLEFDEDTLDDSTCPDDCESAQIVPHRPPQHSGRTGPLNCPSFKIAFDLLWGMCEKEPVRARLAVESILKKKRFPIDLRAALAQAGAGFSFEAIPILHRALDLCQKEECQNPMDKAWDRETDVQEALRGTYTYQERNLSVHSIVGQLYQEKIIGRQVKDSINAQASSQGKARVLLDHLEYSDTDTLMKYCAILEQSAEEEGLKSHLAIAQQIKAALGGSSEKCLQEVIKYLEFDEDTLNDSTCPDDCESAQIVPHRPPQHSGRTGPLNCPSFKIAFDLLWRMCEKEPVRARLAVESVLKKKRFPIDLRAALAQAGAGFSSEAIPILHRALDLCMKEECQNPMLIECRIHWQLMWCHDKLGETEKRDEHLAQALYNANFIGPDFSAAFTFAWSAHVQMCRSAGGISREVEVKTRRLLSTATEYIEKCSEMKWFAEALKLYRADWHLTVAKSYARRNSSDAADVHTDDAEECTRQFPNVPQVKDIAKVESIIREVLSQSELGPVSQFGQYVCQLYLKFGQFYRAHKVLSLVGDHRLLSCIDSVQDQSRSTGLVTCQ